MSEDFDEPSIRYISTIASLAAMTSERTDPTNAIDIVIRPSSRQPVARFFLEFSDEDLVGCCAGSSRTGNVASFDASVLADLKGNHLSGSSAVMNGRVSFAGGWRKLATMSHLVHGARFHSWCRSISAATQGGKGHSKLQATGSGPPVIAVLGSTNDANGRLSTSAMGRLARGLELSRDIADANVVLTGGFGAHFNTTERPHWWYCLEYLEKMGFGRERLIAALNSRHTYEDIHYLANICQRVRPSRILIVSSDYHAARVSFISRLLLPEAEVCSASHVDLPEDAAERLWAHDRDTLGKTFLAAVLFGPDDLNLGLTPSTVEGVTSWSAQTRADPAMLDAGSRGPRSLYVV